MIVLEQYLSVSALTRYIKTKLEGDKHLFSILLKGEISNFKRHSRGHFYFTIKDEGAQISAIMFARDTEKVLFSPKEGDHVLVTGKISVYEPSGTYSLQIANMQLDGVGELYQKYELLKKELEAKGYFRSERKQIIPKFPKIIGVITSPTGAVIEDIKNTVSRRYLLAEIHLYPALVQGPGSSESIASQIKLANLKGDADVLIVGRGGGSIEDLWGFNEMPTIDAIYQSKIPIITAIGHETDFTLSDFVSDLRAPTPTAAAELATPNKGDLLDLISGYQDQIDYKLNQYFGQKKTLLMYLDQRLDNTSPTEKLSLLKTNLSRTSETLHKQMFYNLEAKRNIITQLAGSMRSPDQRIKAYQDKQDYLSSRLTSLIHQLFERKAYQFEVSRASLEGKNPLLLMDKGFAVIEKDSHLVSSVHQIELNDLIEVRLKDGRIKAIVKEKKETT
jgi:exodeoxyribonuclease VII large subunit